MTQTYAIFGFAIWTVKVTVTGSDKTVYVYIGVDGEPYETVVFEEDGSQSIIIPKANKQRVVSWTESNTPINNTSSFQAAESTARESVTVEFTPEKCFPNNPAAFLIPKNTTAMLSAVTTGAARFDFGCQQIIECTIPGRDKSVTFTGSDPNQQMTVPDEKNITSFTMEPFRRDRTLYVLFAHTETSSGEGITPSEVGNILSVDDAQIGLELRSLPAANQTPIIFPGSKPTPVTLPAGGGEKLPYPFPLSAGGSDFRLVTTNK